MASAVDTYTADFGTGTLGTLKFEQFAGFARMTPALDMSSLATDNTECEAFSYHIHAIATGLTAVSDTCGNAVTGGHYIPNQACAGEGFGNQETKEIGDLSGRFGNLGLTTETTAVDFPELIVSSLENRSITIHCVDVVNPQGAANGSRLKCAPLLKTTPSVTAPTTPNTVGNFHARLAGGNHTNWFTGYVAIHDGKVTVKTTNTAAICDQAVSYHIHEKWNNTATEPWSNPTVCGAPGTGGHYDPFVACGGASEYKNTNFCNCSSYDYTASCPPVTTTAYNTGYGCELGDLSGRFGKIASSTGAATLSDLPLGLMLPKDRVGTTSLSIVLHCGSARVACGELALCPDSGCVEPAMVPAPQPPPSPSPSPTPPPPSPSPSPSPTPPSPSPSPTSTCDDCDTPVATACGCNSTAMTCNTSAVPTSEYATHQQCYASAGNCTNMTGVDASNVCQALQGKLYPSGPSPSPTTSPASTVAVGMAGLLATMLF